MAWSYSGDPSSSPRDQVRFLIGDTDETDPQLQDAEVDHLLASGAGALAAAVAACAALSAKYSRMVSKSTGRLSVQASDRAKAYRELAKDLRRQRRGAGLAIFAGGLSISEKESLRQDTDAVQPAFTVRDDDYPATNGPDENSPWPWPRGGGG